MKMFYDDIQEDLSVLEDSNTDFAQEQDSFAETYVFPDPLYHLKLDYSKESVYATWDSKDLLSGTYVLVPTRYGRDIAKVMGTIHKPIGIKPEDVVLIERIANDNDLVLVESLKEKEKTAFKVFQEKVKQHKLDMKLIATHYLFDEAKILFFFSSENRVDFRDLVKDLVSIFKQRIELRQIGVRDESRIIGGLGVCGRSYCCHAVTDRLKPVSIRMAKDQNLSLNSLKISGQCGRLLCCLSYEHEWYCEGRRNLPTEGTRLFYDDTMFRVVEINPLKQMVRLHGEDGRVLEIPASRMEKKEGKWKIQNLLSKN